jgi:uncharacterized RDD family membrane protein YckC
LTLEKKKKIKALKLAPWWKRLLSYGIDSLILFIILVFFVAGIYGDDFIRLFDNIVAVGGFELMKDNPFMVEQFQELGPLSVFEQNLVYWSYIIQSKYSQSIFIISQIISSLYYGLFWGNTGQTIGAMILRIRVISPSRLKPTILSIISRVAALKLIEIAWGFPALIVVNPMLKQRIHDVLSHTVVVEEFKEEDEEDEEEKLDNPQLPDIASEKEHK